MDDIFSKKIDNYEPKCVHDNNQAIISKANAVVNIIFTGKNKIDLIRLARLYPEVEFSSNKFAAAMIRLQPPSSCGLMFAARKCVLSGVKTLSQIIIIAQKYAKILEESSIDVEQIKFKIMNKVICIKTGYKLDLQRLADEMKYKIKYEPKTFNCAIMEPGEEHRIKKAMIFQSGSINFVGVTREKDARKTFDWLEKKLRKFKLVENDIDEKGNFSDKKNVNITKPQKNNKCFNNDSLKVKNIMNYHEEIKGYEINTEEFSEEFIDSDDIVTSSKNGKINHCDKNQIDNTRKKRKLKDIENGNGTESKFLDKFINNNSNKDVKNNNNINYKMTIGAKKLIELENMMKNTNTFNYTKNMFSVKNNNNNTYNGATKKRKLAENVEIFKDIDII